MINVHEEVIAIFTESHLRFFKWISNNILRVVLRVSFRLISNTTLATTTEEWRIESN